MYYLQSNATSMDDAISLMSGCILFVMTPIGITGNTLVILSVIFSNKLRTKTNAFTVSLAATDLLNCATFPVEALSLLGLYAPPSVQWLCAGAGAITTTTILASMNILVLIALNRWAKIKLPNTKYSQWYNRRNIVLMIILAWIHPLCVTLVPQFSGIANLGYSQYYKICTWTDDPVGDYYIGLTMGIPMIIASVIVICAYTSIGLRIRKRNRQVRVAIRAGRETRVTQTLAIVVVLFFFSFMTYVVCSAIEAEKIYFICGATLILANSIINPFVYAFRHPVFSTTLRCILRCRLRSVPKPSRELRFLLRRREIGISDFI